MAPIRPKPIRTISATLLFQPVVVPHCNVPRTGTNSFPKRESLKINFKMVAHFSTSKKRPPIHHLYHASHHELTTKTPPLNTHFCQNPYKTPQPHPKIKFTNHAEFLCAITAPANKVRSLFPHLVVRLKNVAERTEEPQKAIATKRH
jgi:hypothetical protein